jgi:hypothetical protein
MTDTAGLEHLDRAAGVGGESAAHPVAAEARRGLDVGVEMDEQEPREFTVAPTLSSSEVAGGSASCTPARFRLQGQACAGVHHRRPPRMNGGDDLIGGDPL